MSVMVCVRVVRSARASVVGGVVGVVAVGALGVIMPISVREPVGEPMKCPPVDCKEVSCG